MKNTTEKKVRQSLQKLPKQIQSEVRGEKDTQGVLKKDGQHDERSSSSEERRRNGVLQAVPAAPAAPTKR